MGKEIVVGLHFYQPPRKAHHKNLKYINSDPLGIDWTERINKDCYQPIAKAQILDKLSFTYYGCLQEQLNCIDPATSAVFQNNLDKNGVGDPYIHPMLPDLPLEAQKILIGFGAKRHKNKQFFWAPESGLDYQTLGVLKELGYKGVICAPEQLRTTSVGSAENKIINIALAGGESILAIPFNRTISSAVSFMDRDEWNADAVTAKVFKPDHVNKQAAASPFLIWTDGETFGHHLPKANATFLWWLLNVSLPSVGIKPVSINEINTDLTTEGMLVERTAWSCPHGDLKRWNEPCLCHNGKFYEGNLNWKKPFYAAHKNLLHQILTLAENELTGGKKEQFLEFMVEHFDISNHPGEENPPPEIFIARSVSSALTAMTSCGTFFDNPHTSGNINLLYAQQTIEYLKDAGLTKKALELELNYRDSLALIRDPINASRTLLNMLEKLLNQ